MNNKSILIEDIKRELIKKGLIEKDISDTLENRLALLDDLIQKEVFYQKAISADFKEISTGGRSKDEIVKHFLENELFSNPNLIIISEREIEEYYQTHLEEFSTPDMRKGCVIYIEIPEEATKEQKGLLKGKAKEAYRKAKKQGPAFNSFGNLALKYSDDKNSKYKGGDLGWLRKDKPRIDIDDEWMDTLFSLKRKGMLSELIETEKGFYFIKLMDKRPSYLTTLDRVKGFIANKLISQKKQQIIKKYYNNIKKDFNIVINKELLQTIKIYNNSISPPSYPIGPKK